MAIVICLLIAGTILLLAEFFLPGMVAGVAGFCCLIAAVIVSYYKFSALTANLIMVGVMGGVMIGGIIWLLYFPQSRMGKIFVSEGEVGEAGYDFNDLLGKTGYTQSPLGPSGVAIIDEKRYDVVSEGSFVDNGTSIKVVLVEGNRIVVRPV
jgi:membrane-bound serine protease (ClpP class)